MKRNRRRNAILTAGLVAAVAIASASPTLASSHREAPGITEDPVADITDVYAFVSPDRPDTTTLIMNVNPFELPAGGPNFHKFGDDVLYELKVDNNGDAVEDVTYQFRFKTTNTNPNSFLYNTGQVTSLDDADLNVRQSYTVREVREGRRSTLAWNVPVAPANVGPRSMPNYANLSRDAMRPIGNGITAFAGPRDDAFFADLGSIFDLGGLRPLNEAHLIKLPKAEGEDYLAGFNVHTIALQIPTTRLVAGDPVIGVWATASRRGDSERGRNDDGGKWQQVSRLGQPLVNEAVIPIGQKDLFNSSPPSKDAQFAKSVLEPELGKLIPILYPGVQVPTAVSTGLGLGGREDLATIFLTGIPGVNKPANVKPAEMLRLNTTTKSGFPNGRLLSDDVVDVAFQVIAGATDFSPEFKKFPNNALGDGVGANDKPLGTVFPYLAEPFSGYGSTPPAR
jgi:Domain of unknown function (DUF4331)